MIEDIRTRSEYEALVAQHLAVLVYVTSPECSVCSALKPKLMNLLSADFPLLKMACIDSAAAPELAAQLGVFSAPTLLLILDGREYLRQAGTFSMALLRDRLLRPYSLFLGEE